MYIVNVHFSDTNIVHSYSNLLSFRVNTSIQQTSKKVEKAEFFEEVKNLSLRHFTSMKKGLTSFE